MKYAIINGLWAKVLIRRILLLSQEERCAARRTEGR